LFFFAAASQYERFALHVFRPDCASTALVIRISKAVDKAAVRTVRNPFGTSDDQLVNWSYVRKRARPARAISPAHNQRYCASADPQQLVLPDCLGAGSLSRWKMPRSPLQTLKASWPYLSCGVSTADLADANAYFRRRMRPWAGKSPRRRHSQAMTVQAG
jgi:hypothetical protein